VDEPEVQRVESIETDPDARPVSVTAAGIILLATGVFTALIGMILLILIVVNSNPAALPDYVDAAPDGFAGAAGIIGALMIAYGVAASVVGAQVLRRRSGSRGMGIVLAAGGVVALTIALIGPGRTSGASPLIFVPVIAALAYASVALATEGRWFDGTR
jgi:hypothetical protein